MGEDTKQKCCICGESFTGWGNNPAPVKDTQGHDFTSNQYCCDICNNTQVIFARIQQLTGARK